LDVKRQIFQGIWAVLHNLPKEQEIERFARRRWRTCPVSEILENAAESSVVR
jgi:hypothetical protein